MELLPEFAWSAASEIHLERHGVSRDEVEQVLSNDPLGYGLEYRKGELRASFVGASDAGRVLFVVTTKRGRAVGVVTAYPAQPKIKAHYQEFRGGRK